MALALGLRPGSKFYLDDTPVTVLEFNDYNLAKIKIDGKTFTITDKAAVEIMPKVYVSCGKPSEEMLNKYRQLNSLAETERQARKRALDEGKLSQEEYDNLPPISIAHKYLPRLMIDAPRSIVILRGELYGKSKQL